MVWLAFATALLVLGLYLAPASKGRGVGAAVGLAVAGVGALTYAAVGTPDMVGTSPTVAPIAAPIAAPEAPPATLADEPGLDALAAQLEARLRSTGSRDPQGWLLLARSLMNLGRFDAALAAYDQVVAFSESEARPAAEAERARAREFAAEQGAPSLAPRIPGPTAGDVQAAESLSEAERQAMIRGMVDGLAARLEESPDDPEGWARLIRARLVLGERDAAERAVARVRELFSPDVAADVEARSGFAQ